MNITTLQVFGNDIDVTAFGNLQKMNPWLSFEYWGTVVAKQTFRALWQSDCILLLNPTIAEVHQLTRNAPMGHDLTNVIVAGSPEHDKAVNAFKSSMIRFVPDVSWLDYALNGYQY